MSINQIEVPGTLGKYTVDTKGVVRDTTDDDEIVKTYMYSQALHIDLTVGDIKYRVPLAMVTYMAFMDPRIELKELNGKNYGFVDRNRGNVHPYNIFIK